MFSDWLSASWQLGREKLLIVRGCGGNYVFLRFEARTDIGRKERIQGVAEDSGKKLRKPVYGSRGLPQGPGRLLTMEGPLRPRLANSSDFQFGAVATETIENALLHLAQQNEQAVKEAAGRMGSFRETRIVGVDAERGVGRVGVLGALTFIFHSNIFC